MLNESIKNRKHIYKSELVQIQELDSKETIEQISSPAQHKLSPSEGLNSSQWWDNMHGSSTKRSPHGILGSEVNEIFG